ncbi:hypothetical protein ScPMuIL_018970 [Solemya velum]
MANDKCTVGLGKLRRAVISFYEDVMLNLYNVRIKVPGRDKRFKSGTELPKRAAVDIGLVKDLTCERIRRIFPDDEGEQKLFSKLCSSFVEERTVKGLVDKMYRVSKEALNVLKDWGVENEIYAGVVPKDDITGLFNIDIDEDCNRLYLHWDTDILSSDFMLAVSRLAQVLRDQGRQPTSIEFLSFHLAYYNLLHGHAMRHEHARCLGTPGFRPDTQTYMSLTDPGDGHLLGTTRFNEWMKGAIIHVEHLERPRNLPRQNIESYRIPSIYDFTKVRLHVGAAAPTTYFVGRPIKDSGNFNEDFLKLVNITAAAATAAFQHGAAECKVAMEGLSTSQAVKYMHALRAQVQRKRKQFLSAAWNLNQVIVDDYYSDGEPIELKQRMEIATRAIEITAIGGFDKLTWDGASDTYPSKCIMYQLNLEEALTIVHEAHIRGLVTYFSAGFKFPEIKLAVYAGVDGIGIGGAQVLRYMDGETGMHGPFMEENIPIIMASRNQAAASVRGRGVHLLARLDTMFFEGSISENQDVLRLALFEALKEANEERIDDLIGQLQCVTSLPCECNHPLIGTAKRLVEAEKPQLKNFVDTAEVWCSFMKQLKSLVLAKDSESLAEEYDSDPWMSMREKYRKQQWDSHRTITRTISTDIAFKRF